MEEFLLGIERIGAVEALKSSFFAYPLVNALHILAIGTVASTAILMDLRVLGGFRSVATPVFLGILRPVCLAAFVVAVATGLAMFAVKAVEYVENPFFRWKLVLIGAAAANFLVFRTLLPTGGAERPALAARLSALLSILLWLGVVVAGRFIGF